jgi:hypothetical protein
LARAKRTDRTDARRRYRAQFAEDNGTADDVEELADTTETMANGPARRRQGAGARAATASSGASTPAPVARPARPGLIASARAAYHPAHIREDLALLPGLLFHWSLLVTIGVAVVATAVFIASTNDLAASIDFSAANPFQGKEASAASNLSYQVIAMFVAPPPVAGALIIGFFAKRASWLLGLIFGLAAALCYVVLLTMPAGRVLIGLNPPAAYIVPAFLLSPLGAMLFASGAVWYRRFLQSMGPSPSQRGKPAAKPVQGRGNVRRNRLSS